MPITKRFTKRSHKVGGKKSRRNLRNISRKVGGKKSHRRLRRLRKASRNVGGRWRRNLRKTYRKGGGEGASASGYEPEGDDEPPTADEMARLERASFGKDGQEALDNNYIIHYMIMTTLGNDNPSDLDEKALINEILNENKGLALTLANKLAHIVRMGLRRAGAGDEGVASPDEICQHLGDGVDDFSVEFKADGEKMREVMRGLPKNFMQMMDPLDVLEELKDGGVNDARPVRILLFALGFIEWNKTSGKEVTKGLGLAWRSHSPNQWVGGKEPWWIRYD